MIHIEAGIFVNLSANGVQKMNLSIMKANVTLTLDTRHQDKNGNYPIILRISFKRRNTSIRAGYSIPEKYWNNSKREVKNSYQGTSSVVRLNNLLLKKKANALNVITDLEDKGILWKMSVGQIKQQIVKEKTDSDFFSFTMKHISELKEARRIGTARSYKFTMDAVKKFHGKEKLPFTHITYEFLSRMETNHLAKGNARNGFAVYMRTVRAIFNKAIKSGEVDRGSYPFDDFKITTEPTRKRAISLEAIQGIENLHLESEGMLQLSKDLFLSSLYLNGMNFSDLCFLTWNSIKGDRMQIQRAKTHQQFDMVIIPRMMEILDRYRLSSSKAEDYIFPIIKRLKPTEIDKDIQWARSRHNKRLKVIGEKAGINETLTTYVARHSFATIAKQKNIPISAIQELLGHSSIKTTEIYLDSLSSDILDDYQRSVLE